jgi:hypothetical protein
LADYSSAHHCSATCGLFPRPDGRQKYGGKKISGLDVFAPMFLPFALCLAGAARRPCQKDAAPARLHGALNA